MAEVQLEKVTEPCKLYVLCCGKQNRSLPLPTFHLWLSPHLQDKPYFTLL